MTMMLGALVVTVLVAGVAVRSCPLARMVGLSLRSFAEASRGGSDFLR